MFIKEFITLPMILMLIGGILVLIGGAMNTYNANKENFESIKRDKKHAEEIKNYAERLNEKNEIITKLGEKNFNMITGGDSFPFIFPCIYAGAPEKMYFLLVNSGQYPLYDITVTLKDLVKLEEVIQKNKTNGYEETLSTKEWMTKSDISNMRPTQIIRNFHSVKIPEIGKIDYLIEISARNCFVEISFTEEYYSKKIKDRKRTKFITKVNGNIIDQNDLDKIVSKKIPVSE